MGSGLAFDLEIFVSPGLYICGEEARCSRRSRASAPSRATSRRIPGQVGGGLWGRPTVDQQRRDLLLRPRDPLEGRGLDEDVRAQRLAGHEVRRRQRRRREPRRLRSADGDVVPRADRRAGRRRRPGPHAEVVRAVGSGRRLSPGVDARSAARLERDDGGRRDGRLRRDRRLRRPRLHARHGAQLGALLPQRVVRQVRAVPHRLGQDGRDADRVDEGAARRARPRPLRGAVPRAEDDLDLRPRPGRPRADRVGHEALPRRGRGARRRASARPASASGSERAA